MKSILVDYNTARGIKDGKVTQLRKPYGCGNSWKAGETYYVKESTAIIQDITGRDKLIYRTDVNYSMVSWTPANQMSESDARIFVRINKVWVSKVQFATLEDIKAMGLFDMLNSMYKVVQNKAQTAEEVSLISGLIYKEFRKYWNRKYRYWRHPDPWGENGLVRCCEIELIS